MAPLDLGRMSADVSLVVERLSPETIAHDDPSVPSDITQPSSLGSPWTPQFSRFFIAQCISWLGSSLTPVALSFGVLRATGNVTDLGTVLAANTVPMIGLLLLGGVAADRIPRRLLLTSTHLLAGLAQAGTACWFLLGGRSVGVLVVLAALSGCATAFTAPALRGIITDLVPPAALGQANAARTASRNATRMFGPGLAGVLVAVISPGWVLAVDAACLLIAAVVMSTVRTGARPEASNPPSSVVELLLEGWSEFAMHRWLLVVSCAFLCLNVLIGGIWLVLGPVIAEKEFGAPGWGLVLGARAAGQVLGAAVAYRWSPRRPLIAVLLLPLPYAAVFLALGLGSGVALLMILAVVAGVGSAIGDVVWETTLQHRVSPGALARVASLDMLLSFVSVPVGQVSAPVLAAVLGAPVIAVAGGVLCVAALLIPLASPTVRRLDDGRGSAQ